jgi:hypothetical protein
MLKQMLLQRDYLPDNMLRLLSRMETKILFHNPLVGCKTGTPVIDIPHPLPPN